MDFTRCDIEEGLDGTLNLARMRTMPEVVESIRWDVTPQVLMEPRFQSNPEDLKKLREITGYMFYIETQCGDPALMLMKVGRTDISSTVGKIDEISKDLIQKAIDSPVHKPFFGMYAISEEIKAWLKKELGL